MSARRLSSFALALTAVLAVAGVSKREDITRLFAVNSLFDDNKIVHNFSNMEALFHTAPMPGAAAGAPRPLPLAPLPAALPEGFDDWVQERSITGLVVLHRGELVHQSYYLGTGSDDVRISWALANSFLAALVGIYVENGTIASIADPVEKYAPALKGSAYEGVTIRNVMNMASGVEFDEDYLNFWSDINRMGRLVGLGGSLDGFATSITERADPPGEAFRYVSMDTHVLGMVLRGVTGQSIPELMERNLLAPLGLERAAYYLADGEGTAFVLGGLNLTTRDYARFGQMVLEGGAGIVPENWVMEMTAASAPRGADETERYGYQWWLPADGRAGEVFARGIYGQYIWIDRAADVVIAVNAADRDFSKPGVRDTNVAMMRDIVEAVR